MSNIDKVMFIIAILIIIFIFCANSCYTEYTISFLDMNGKIIRTEKLSYMELQSQETSKTLVYIKDGKTITYTGPFILEKKIIVKEK